MTRYCKVICLSSMYDSWNNFWLKQEKPLPREISWSKQRMLCLLENYLTENKRVLDAGCGSGFFSKIFCDFHLKTVSLDYSPASLELTRKITAGRSLIIKANLLEQNLSAIFPESFDLIFSDGLFEHFSVIDQNRIMKIFLSILSSQGVVVTFVPNRWSPWQIIRPFFMPGITERPFTLRELLDLNQRNGLKLIASGGINTLPFRLSPEGNFAAKFGMLLYTISTIK